MTDDLITRPTFTCLTCGTVHFTTEAYIACKYSHPPPSLVDRLRNGSIDDDLLDAAKAAADEIERLRAAAQQARDALSDAEHALELGLDALRESADRYHAEMEGYRAAMHNAKEMDYTGAETAWKTVRETMRALDAALKETP